MFITAYILILCLSAGFAAWVITTASVRAGLLMGSVQKFSHAVVATSVSMAFLIVVGAPAVIILGAIGLCIAGAYISRMRYQPFCRFGVPVLAVAIGFTSLTIAPLFSLPLPAIGGLAALLWLGITFSGELLGEPYPPAALACSIALIPLMAAPFLGAPSWIALDASLILAALAGAGLATGRNALTGVARIAVAFIIGWLMVEAALHGAWLAAGISVALWFAALGYAYYEDPSRQNNAFNF